MLVRKTSGATVWSALAGIALLLSGIAAVPANSQTAAGSPQRDCQTVRTCNFARNAAVRGCLSSYTCRTCRPVKTRCPVGDKRRVCQEVVCTWGG